MGQMRILLDILHPAHVHFFRIFREEMLMRGHAVKVTARRKDVTLNLLDAYDIPFEVLSHESRSRIGAVQELIVRTRRLVRVCKEFQPDIVMGIMGVSAVPAGRLARCSTAVLYDTEIARQSNRFIFPIADYVITPECFSAPVHGNHVTYNGYHELAYLHPSRFRPDSAALRDFGLSAKEPFVLVRLVSRSASHDVGDRWMSHDQQMRMVDELAKHARVVVSSETELSTNLNALRLTGPVEKIHHVIAQSRLVLGESATMASEAAVLGTPAVLISHTSRGYIDDLSSRYGLVERVSPDQWESGLRRAISYLSAAPEVYIGAQQQLLRDHIDVTGWLVEWCEATQARNRLD